ncbi:putative late blight resistance protein homolog R1A-10 [Nicotiana sylvestris]|uniref:putative late blight resistance protein homolog R1A-10 n=1 Tax=Nicotiana sylvestris TaxID=4096 RepID=UPI00388C5B61
MRIHFFRRVEILVIDAGLIVYSLYDSSKSKEDRNQDLFLLADKIQLVKNQIYLDIREGIQPHLPKNDVLGFFVFLLNGLKELLSSHADSLASVQNELDVVHEELQLLQPFLEDVARQRHNKPEELQNLAERVIDKAYEVEYIVDSFVVRDIPHTYLTVWLSEIIWEIKLIKTELTKSSVKNMTIASSSADEELIGFDDVRETIRGQLVRVSPELDVISIVGMAGTGKTTLARSFIKNDSHFDFWGECRVSQVYTRKDLLLSILSSNCDPTEISKEADDELADRLRKLLLTKRYLLIIDDVWEVKAWDDLILCFPDARNGSRIILTTRLQKVAVYAKRVTEPHFLRPLNEQESWLLLQKRVFGKEICPEQLKEVGEKIAKKCDGLPLSIVLVAGLLTKMDRTEGCWTQMELSFGERIQDGAKDLVKLSYNDLPYKLKPCFLYFGAFLEDREISVSKVTCLWISEAFIENDGEKCLEDIAEDYLDDLIGRNLVMVTKKRSIGKNKACRVHDLMLDFCKEKAEEDNFLLWLKRDLDANPPHFYSEKPVHRAYHFALIRMILLGGGHHAHTLVQYYSGRYLAVQTTEDSIPSSKENLWNLQTFIVKRNGGHVLLPDTLWKLSKLRNVSISDSALFNLRGARESLDENPSKLDNLATLSSIYVSRKDNMERIHTRDRSVNIKLSNESQEIDIMQISFAAC